MNYFSWISENYPDRESCKNKCVEATLEMQKVFPELTRVRGHYEDVMFGSRPHWWLKTPEGKIVDPTAKQFSVVSLDSDYTEQDESNVPTGKCIECGKYTYNHKCFCSDECNKKCGDRMNRTDLAYRNYGLPNEAFQKLQELNKKRLEDNPICEICKIEKSTRITGLGTLRACCQSCNENIYKHLEEYRKIKEEFHSTQGYERDLVW